MRGPPVFRLNNGPSLMHTSDIVIMRAAVLFEKSTDRNSSRSPTAAAVSGPLPYKVPL